VEEVLPCHSGSVLARRLARLPTAPRDAQALAALASVKLEVAAAAAKHQQQRRRRRRHVGAPHAAETTATATRHVSSAAQVDVARRLLEAVLALHPQHTGALVQLAFV
jgi:hypothetical protein